MTLQDLLEHETQQATSLNMTTSFTHHIAQLTSQGNSGLKLPKLTHPTFFGKHTEWMPFWDLFEAAVDSNASLSSVQKLRSKNQQNNSGS